MATYPNESYPADAAILALDGQTDLATGLAYIARGTSAHSAPPYEVQYNRRLQRQNRILTALRQGMVVDEGGLKIGVFPIDYTLGGTRKSFAGASNVSVPDNTVRKVYIDAGNVLQVAASFPGDLSTFLPLATVAAVGGSLTVVDERAATLFTVS